MKNPIVALKIVLWASLLYLIIFGAAWAYNSMIVQPTKAIQASVPLNSTQGQTINASIIGQSISQSSNSQQNLLKIEVIVSEVVLISLVVLLEMKFKLISRLLKIKNILQILTIAGLAVFATVYVLSFGWLIGILLTIGMLIFLVIWERIFKYIEDITLAVIFIMLSIAIMWALLMPISYLATTNTQTQILIRFGLLIPLAAIGILIIRGLVKGKSLKNALNLATFFAALGSSIYFGLFINIWFIMALLVLMLIYDFIAVWVLGTMQFMAGKLTKQLVPAMFLFGSEEGINKKLDALVKGKKIRGSKKDKNDSGILGAGDIILPSAGFCSAIFYLPKIAPYMLIGAIIGIATCGAVMELGIGRKGIPALVFIVPFVLLFAGVGLVI